MFKTLLFIQLRALFYTMFMTKRVTGSKGSKTLIKKLFIGLLTVYLIGCMLFFFGVVAMQLCEPLVKNGLDLVYFVLIGLMAFFLMFIGSIFITEKQLYEANDNELLLSMPVPAVYVVLSRITAVLLVNILYGAFTLIPATAVYFFRVGFDAVILVYLILGGLFLSLLSLSLSAAGGWLLALFISNLKRKKLFSTVFMLAFFFSFMGLYTNLQKILTRLVARGAELTDSLRKVFPPLFLFGKSVAEKDLPSLIALLFISLVSVTIITLLISRSFIKIATKNKGSAGKYIYKQRHLTAASPRKALFIKEFKRFFSSVNYIMNSGLGSIFMIIFAGALVIKGPSVITSLLQTAVNNHSPTGFDIPLDSLLPVIIGAVIGFLVTTNDTACCSLSLEGKAFPLLKSMPLGYYDIIVPKIAFNLAWGAIPVVLISVACFFRLGCSSWESLLILLAGIIFQLFTALWGMLCNILFPKFDWISEVMVIKQSAASLFGILGAMGFFGLYAGGFILFSLNANGGEGLSLEQVSRIALPSAIGFFSLIAAVCAALLASVAKKKFHAISA
ncbi:MAG: hypothetical protein BWY46_00330 [Firmicutes bacterium ADurb.Bin300]|nr:MAG: hypothetical protein BWY46_00330 [Firmicutes bacterium ADurb.Bin300]